MLRDMACHGRMDVRVSPVPAPLPRSAGILVQRRERLEWGSDRPFRILSIDGGGIRGIFPAGVLTELESQYLDGESIVDYFDLVTGTSTGGILALGLAAGQKAGDLLSLYVDRGNEVFPVRGRALRKATQWLKAGYDRGPLDRILAEVLGNRKLRDASVRLCIPSLDWNYSDTYVFKTPHHPDFKKDGNEPMAKVAAATAAAPTFFRPVEDGHVLADGGVWANNPIMIGLVEAMSSFMVRRADISILSIGCGEAPYTINRLQKWFGGKLPWASIMFAAMHFQSMNAIGQAGLLIGRDKIMRLVPQAGGTIPLDDWKTAVAVLPDEAREAVAKHGERIAHDFLTTKAVRVPGIGCWDATASC